MAFNTNERLPGDEKILENKNAINVRDLEKGKRYTAYDLVHVREDENAKPLGNGIITNKSPTPPNKTVITFDFDEGFDIFGNEGFQEEYQEGSNVGINKRFFVEEENIEGGKRKVSKRRKTKGASRKRKLKRSTRRKHL